MKTGASVTAADHSPESVARVAETYAGREVFAGAHTVQDLEQRGETFDVIFLIEVIEHLTDEALQELFGRVRKVAAPGARLIVTTPNQEKLEKKEVFCPACDHTFHRWGHVRSWSDVSLALYMKEQGWDMRQTLVTNFPKRIPGRRWKSLWNHLEAGLSPKKDNLALVCQLVDV